MNNNAIYKYGLEPLDGLALCLMGMGWVLGRAELVSSDAAGWMVTIGQLLLIIGLRPFGRRLQPLLQDKPDAIRSRRSFGLFLLMMAWIPILLLYVALFGNPASPFDARAIITLAVAAAGCLGLGALAVRPSRTVVGGLWPHPAILVAFLLLGALEVLVTVVVLSTAA